MKLKGLGVALVATVGVIVGLAAPAGAVANSGNPPNTAVAQYSWAAANTPRASVGAISQGNGAVKAGVSVACSTTGWTLPMIDLSTPATPGVSNVKSMPIGGPCASGGVVIGIYFIEYFPFGRYCWDGVTWGWNKGGLCTTTNPPS